MTTNVYDKAAAKVATDSRWSQRLGRWLVYVDDANFHKIENTETTVFMFAGKGNRIQEWKDWLQTGANQHSVPEFEGICIFAVDKTSQEVKICEGLPIVSEVAVFGGSGSRFAFVCWDKNKDIIRSVETAKEYDPATGGPTIFYELQSNKHNLHIGPTAKSNLTAVNEALLSRGTVMDIGNTLPTPYKLSELAASNDEVSQLQAKIASGELSAEAPSAEMYSEWTHERKDRVKSALADIFKWK